MIYYTSTYYLVETKAPPGYSEPSEPWEINWTHAETFTELGKETSQTTRPDTLPYNWMQTVQVQSIAGANIQQANSDYGKIDAADAALVNNNPISENTTVYYRIANNPCYELPATGGPGTTLIYLIGTILIAGAAGILMRQRSKTV